MPKIPGMSGQRISNRVERADLATSGNPVYQEMANIGGQIASIGQDMRRKELDAEAFDYVQEGARSSLDLDNNLSLLKKEHPKGNGYAEAAKELILTHQQDYYDKAPSDHAKRVAQKSLGGEYLSKERRAGTIELGLKESHRDLQRDTDSKTDGLKFRQGADFKEAVKFMGLWDARQQRELLDAPLNKHTAIKRDVLAAKNDIAEEYILYRIRSGDDKLLDEAERVLTKQDKHSDLLVENLTPAQSNSYLKRIQQSREKKNINSKRMDALDLSDLWKKSRTGFKPMTEREMQFGNEKLESLKNNPTVTKEEFNAAATGFATAMGYSEILTNVQETGAMPSEENMKSMADKYYRNIAGSEARKYLRKEDFTKEVSSQLGRLQAMKNDKKTSLNYIKTMDPVLGDMIEDSRFDAINPPSGDQVDRMKFIQRELDMAKQKNGISGNNMTYLLPQHKAALEEAVSASRGPKPNDVLLRSTIMNMSELYGPRFTTALKESKMDEFAFLPYMKSADVQLAALQSNDPEGVEVSDQRMEINKLSPKTVRDDLRSAIASTPLLKSMAMERFSESPGTANAELLAMTKMLTGLAYQNYAKDLIDGDADMSNSVNFAMESIDINSGQDTVGFNVIETGNGGNLALDSSVDIDHETMSEYLTNGFGWSVYSRNFAKEWNVNLEGFTEDIVNEDIRSSGMFVRNPDNTISIRYTQGNGDVTILRSATPIKIDGKDVYLPITLRPEEIKEGGKLHEAYLNNTENYSKLRKKYGSRRVPMTSIFRSASDI